MYRRADGKRGRIQAPAPRQRASCSWITNLEFAKEFVGHLQSLGVAATEILVIEGISLLAVKLLNSLTNKPCPPGTRYWRIGEGLPLQKVGVAGCCAGIKKLRKELEIAVP